MVNLKRALSVALTLLLIVPLTACGDYRPIEASFNVVAVAIDGAGDDTSTYKVTVIGADYPKTKLTLSGQGKSVMDAMNVIQNQTSKFVILSHVETILFSRAVAEDGLDQLLDMFFRNMQIRSDASAVVVAGKAADYLNQTNSKTPITGRTFAYQMRTGAVQFDPHFVNLHSLMLEATVERRNYVLPYFQLRKKQKVIQFAGMAICRKGHMIARLSLKETNAFLILRRVITKQWLTLAKADTTLQFSYRKPTVKTTWRHGQVHFHYVIRMKDQIVEQAPFRVKPIRSKKAEGLQRMAQVQLKKQCIQLVKKLQDNEVDPLALAEPARVANPAAFDAKTWDRTFANATFSFRFEMKVERFGQMF